MGKVVSTWTLMRASWGVLKKDKEMIIFPIISCIACLIVMASFAYPIYLTGQWRPPAANAPSTYQFSFYLTLFLLYFCNYFVIVFFNAGIVACATIRIGGGDPTVLDGMRAVTKRFVPIVGWALLLSTVGLILRFIGRRSSTGGRIAAGLLGVSWSMASFLVVPILVVEGKGPFAALSKSISLLRRSWGKQLIGNFSFGLVIFLFSLPAFLVIGLVAYIGFGYLTIFFAILAVEYLLVLSVIQSTLYSIFQAAFYSHVRSGTESLTSQLDDLSHALRLYDIRNDIKTGAGELS
jgi:hypothetical protein